MILNKLQARCGSCGHEFACPQLGDFSYGEFIFYGERGSVQAYFQAIDNPVWNFLKKVLGDHGTRPALGPTLQAACAHFADPIEGQALINHIVCPLCFSTKMDWYGGDVAGSVEVLPVSFESFQSLSEPERHRRAVAYIEAKQLLQPED